MYGALIWIQVTYGSTSLHQVVALVPCPRISRSDGGNGANRSGANRLRERKTQMKRSKLKLDRVSQHLSAYSYHILWYTVILFPFNGLRTTVGQLSSNERTWKAYFSGCHGSCWKLHNQLSYIVVIILLHTSIL